MVDTYPAPSTFWMEPSSALLSSPAQPGRQVTIRKLTRTSIVGAGPYPASAAGSAWRGEAECPPSRKKNVNRPGSDTPISWHAIN